MLDAFGLSPFRPAFKGFRRAIVGNLSLRKIHKVMIGACHDHHPVAGENSTRYSSDVKPIGDPLFGNTKADLDAQPDRHTGFL